MSLPSVESARAMMIASVSELPAEEVDCPGAVGRVLRLDVIAECDQPPFAVSSMDGWAVRREDVPAVLEIVGESAAGHGWTGQLGAGKAIRISTGAAIPDGADWVVIQEDAVRESDRVRVGPLGGTNFIRPRAADYAKGDLILSIGARLDPWRIALLSSAGRSSVQVSARPRVAIVSTGDELASPGSPVGEWQIHDSVGPGLAAWFGLRGCEVNLLAALPDDLTAVSDALRAVDCDLLVTIGGASVGDHDIIKPALRSLGLEMIVDGVAVRPGKPTWFGLLGDGRRVLGLPGNPVSAMVCAELFAAPILAALEGGSSEGGQRHARLAAALPANGPREHFMRATLHYDGQGGVIAEAAANQDSSMLTVLANASALIRRLAHAPAAQISEEVEVLILNPALLAR